MNSTSTITTIKDTNAPANTVRIITGRLGGKWLESLGFFPGDVLIASASPGAITYRLQEDGVDRTLELVKFARKHKLVLMQVILLGRYSYIKIPRSCLKKSGLTLDEPLYAIYEPGLLKIQRSDLS